MIATYGLTGGIACGKTTVSQMFTELGVPVIDADIIAKQILEQTPAIRQQLLTHFGPQLLSTDEHIDRAWLRRRIFEVPADKKWLEQLLHPLIRAEIMRQRQQTTGPYMILVVPLLIEHINNYADLAGIIVVDVDEAEQRRRLIKRDQHDIELIDKIIAAQYNRRQRLGKADFILNNQQDVDALRQQVQALHQQLSSRAATT